MKKRLIQIAIMLAACCAYGQGTLVYDQQVSNTNAPGGYGNIQPDPSGQSFVPSLSSVGFVQFYLSDGNPDQLGATLYVNLWSGSLAGGTLLGQTAPVSLSGSFFGVTTFLFSAPVTVSPGTTYYFQPIVQSGDSEQIGVLPGSAYTSGTAFFQGNAQPNTDLWFGEGIVVPEPSSAALILIGMTAFYFRNRKTQQSTTKEL
ncbi:MAG: PEP-CTERM sorting domain-containing protein [Limisphaerales bacterium]